MKKLLGIIVLGLFLITPTQADDIRNFQIEGMSVGDSALDYFTKEEIKNNESVPDEPISEEDVESSEKNGDSNES